MLDSQWGPPVASPDEKLYGYILRLGFDRIEHIYMKQQKTADNKYIPADIEAKCPPATLALALRAGSK